MRAEVWFWPSKQPLGCWRVTRQPLVGGAAKLMCKAVDGTDRRRTIRDLMIGRYNVVLDAASRLEVGGDKPGGWRLELRDGQGYLAGCAFLFDDGHGYALATITPVSDAGNGALQEIGGHDALVRAWDVEDRSDEPVGNGKGSVT